MTRKKEMMTKRIMKSSLALALCGAMLFGAVKIPAGNKTSLNFGTETVYAADTDMDTLFTNISELQDAVGRLHPAQKGFFDTINGIAQPITSIAGIYNSSTTLLKMAGIMKDPVSEKLAHISSTLDGMTASLSSMNKTLTAVAEKIDAATAKQETMDRKSTSLSMSNRVKNFNDNYVRPIDSLMVTYEDLINKGFRSWFSEIDKNTISSPDGMITLEGEYVTSAMKGVVYRVNTYRETIITNLAAEIRSCADKGTLKADDSFYKTWKTLSEDEKNEKTESLAEECFNSLASQISYQQMNNNTEFVSTVYDSFNKYCEKLTEEGSPLDAQIKVLYLTHAFEGEVKDQIQEIIDTSTIITGTFAAMTLSVMKQDEMQSEKRLKTVENNWKKVTNFLKSEKANAITGYDNYCYLTDSLVCYETRDLYYGNRIQDKVDESSSFDKCSYYKDSFTAEDLLKDGDRIMGTAETMVLYSIYAQNAASEGSFYNFLGNEGVGASDGANTRLVTEYDGWNDFSPNEGIGMNFGHGAKKGGRDYWGDSFQATVNSGNKSGVENQYFKNCKKATATVFNPATGQSNSNQLIGAIATYEEDHWRWLKDEMYLMGYADTCEYEHYESEFYTYRYYEDIYHYHTTCAVLVLKEVPAKTTTDLADPIDAFDACQIEKGFEDVMPAEHNEYSNTDVNPNPEKMIPEEEVVEESGNTEEDANEGVTGNTDENSTTEDTIWSAVQEGVENSNNEDYNTETILDEVSAFINDMF